MTDELNLISHLNISVHLESAFLVALVASSKFIVKSFHFEIVLITNKFRLTYYTSIFSIATASTITNFIKKTKMKGNQS